MNFVLLYQVAYVGVAICLGVINGHLILKDKHPSHFLNGVMHITFAAIYGWLTWWPLSLCILLNTRVFFDAATNLTRKLSVDYVSPKPSSFVDKVEKKIFKNNGLLPKLTWLLISFTLTSVYFIFIT
jgi:hypothetical protein